MTNTPETQSITVRIPPDREAARWLAHVVDQLNIPASEVNTYLGVKLWLNHVMAEPQTDETGQPELRAVGKTD